MFERLFATSALRRLKWEEGGCPICKSEHRELLISRDRYLQKVDISQCSDCGHVFTSRNLSKADLAPFYKSIYRHLYENISVVGPEYAYQSKDKLKAAYRYSQIVRTIGGFDSVVEVGSGLGYFLRECVDHGVRKVIGLEPNGVFFSFANDTLGLGGRVFNKMYESPGDVLPDANLFALFHVLEHLEDPGLLLSDIARQLGKGWLVIEVPDIENGWESLGRFNFHLGHRHYFSIETLEKLLNRSGLGVHSYATEFDDGIYPGNMRVFVRRQETTSKSVVGNSPTRRKQVREKVIRYGRTRGMRNGLLRAAFRLFKP